MPVKVRDVRQMLVGKLRAEESEGSKHQKYRIVENDMLVANTVLSRSYAEIDDRLLGKIGGQLGVDRQQMRRLLDCTWSRDDYLAHMMHKR